MNAIRLIVMPACLALAGCGVSGPVSISASPQSALPAQVSLEAAQSGDDDARLARFVTRLNADLAAEGIRVSSGASYRLIVSLSESDSSLGVTQDKGGEGQAVSWQSAPRTHRWYQRCRARRITAAAVGLGMAGTAALRSTASTVLCSVDEADLDRLADALASSFTRQASQATPQG